MADDTQEKKLPPSQRKRQEARRKGNIPTSRDLAMALGALAATAALAGGGTALLRRLTNAVAGGFVRMGEHPTRDLTVDDLTPLIFSGGILIAMTVGPVALAAAGTSVAGTLLQTKFSFNTERLKLNWERLNPANGLAKLKPSNAGIDTLKTILIGVVLSIIGWKLGKAMTHESARLVWSDPLTALSYGWDEALRLLWQAGFVFLLVGAADFGVQKWRHTRSLRMSKQEVHDEHKMTEQKPEVKNAIRRAQMQLRRRNMMKAVPTATVVLTNPTHFAVALEYNRAKSSAPIVVAKGADLIAFKIREVARQHSVPVIENPALTRAIFKECEIGDTIPGPLFGAVAEVLAYLIRIKQLVL